MFLNGSSLSPLSISALESIFVSTTPAPHFLLPCKSIHSLLWQSMGMRADCQIPEHRRSSFVLPPGANAPDSSGRLLKYSGFHQAQFYVTKQVSVPIPVGKGEVPKLTNSSWDTSGCPTTQFNSYTTYPEIGSDSTGWVQSYKTAPHSNFRPKPLILGIDRLYTSEVPKASSSGGNDLLEWITEIRETFYWLSHWFIKRI